MTSQHATLELSIHTMDCSDCAKHLESVVKEIGGVTKVTTLLADQKAVVLYDTVKTTPAVIRESIEAAGYVILAEGEEPAELPGTFQPSQPTAPAGRQDQLHIENMDCPTEEALIRSKLKGFPGVTGTRIQSPTKRPHHFAYSAIAGFGGSCPESHRHACWGGGATG